MTPKKPRERSDQYSNHEVFLWAMYLLGGADRDVDVEDIYMKCFELAPRRLSWRTRPDIPDSKKASKALVDAEAKTDFIYRPHGHARRLTKQGIDWISENQRRLQVMYGKDIAPPPLTNEYVQRTKRIKNHLIWSCFKGKAHEDEFVLLADALECSPASPLETWMGRFTELDRIGMFLKDRDLIEFADYARKVHREGLTINE